MVSKSALRLVWTTILSESRDKISAKHFISDCRLNKLSKPSLTREFKLLQRYLVGYIIVVPVFERC